MRDRKASLLAGFGTSGLVGVVDAKVMPPSAPGAAGLVNASPSRDGFEGDVISRLLELARTSTGMELSWASIADGRESFELFSGDPSAFGLSVMDPELLRASYCAGVLEGRIANIVPDVRADPTTSAFEDTHDLAIGSYLGVAIPGAGDEPRGVLCCVSRSINRANGSSELRLVELLAAALGEYLTSAGPQHDRSRRIRDRVGRVLAGGDLVAVYQPIVHLQTAQTIGAEALARFPAEPRRPDIWFADAESVGMGQALELAAVRAALAGLVELPQSVYLSVNASPSLMLSAEFLDVLRTVACDRIVVELTEHAAVDDYAALIDAIGRIRALGARLAIDDVGSGFASFNHVLRLQPDVVKLDIAITRAVDSDLARRGLARGLLSVAHDIGATVVAEGVETQGELDTLFHLGVDAAQGFFLARPGPLPLPDNMPRPTPRLIGAASGFGDENDALAFLARTWIESNDLESVTRPLLDALLDRTGLETSYLTIRDRQSGALEHRFVRNSGEIALPEGLVVPWQDTLCKRCRDADINWTADVPADLPGCDAAEALGVQTFLSIPVVARDGTELGTLCAASTETRFVGATTIAEIEIMARLIADSCQPEPVESANRA